MKTPLTPILLFVIASLTYSCSKNDQPAPETQVEQIKVSFTNVIWYQLFKMNNETQKMLSLTDSAKGQVITTSNFIYDANGRMSKVNFVQQGSLTASYEFEYNAAGAIIKRQSKSGALETSQDYNTYSYDAYSHMIADSLFSKGNGDTYQLISVSEFQYTAGNVTEAAYYKVVNGALQLETRRKYEYDSAQNPYRKLQDYYYYCESGSAIYDVIITGDNNAIKEYTAMGNGPFELTKTSIYQYNASNYPVSIKPGFATGADKLVGIEFLYK